MEEKCLQCLAFLGMILVVASETVNIFMKMFNRVKTLLSYTKE
jgi:hypothetical protein